MCGSSSTLQLHILPAMKDGGGSIILWETFSSAVMENLHKIVCTSEMFESVCTTEFITKYFF